MMDSPLLLYKPNSKTIKELNDIHKAVTLHLPLLTEPAEEILRAQLVHIVSAFDCYMHDCVRICLMEIFCGTRSNENKGAFHLSFESLVTVEKGQTKLEKQHLLESIIVKKISEDSYHSPKGVEYALSLIGIKRVWKLLSTKLNIDPYEIRMQLALIVDRRNKIVHEADYNSVTGSKTPINSKHVESVIDFIDKCVIALDDIIFPKSL